MLYLKSKCMFSFKPYILKNWWFPFTKHPGLWNNFTVNIQLKSFTVVTQIAWHLNALSLITSQDYIQSSLWKTTYSPGYFSSNQTSSDQYFWGSIGSQNILTLPELHQHVPNIDWSVHCNHQLTPFWTWAYPLSHIFCTLSLCLNVKKPLVEGNELANLEPEHIPILNNTSMQHLPSMDKIESNIYIVPALIQLMIWESKMEDRVTTKEGKKEEGKLRQVNSVKMLSSSRAWGALSEYCGQWSCAEM